CRRQVALGLDPASHGLLGERNLRERTRGRVEIVRLPKLLESLGVAMIAPQLKSLLDEIRRAAVGPGQSSQQNGDKRQDTRSGSHQSYSTMGDSFVPRMGEGRGDN